MFAEGQATPDSPSALVAASYDETRDVLTFDFYNGRIELARKTIWEVRDADPTQLREIDVQPDRHGISIDALDVDIWVPGLIAEEFGFLFARANGCKAKGHTSEKKARASALNGRLGGRPKTKKTNSGRA